MTYQQWLMLQRNKYPGIRMQPSRPGPYGEPQFASFGGRPAWMDQKQPPPPETWGGLLSGMAGQEDRLDSMPDTETTTVIKESLDPEVATTKTTTVKGDPNFKRMLPGQDMGMIDPSWSGATAVNRPPITNLPGTDFFGGEPTAPPGPVPPPQVDVGQGDFPGRTAEFDERGMQDWNAQMAQLRNRQETGGAAPTQAQVEESLGRYGDFRRQQLTPPPVGRTFGQDDPMAYAPPQAQIDPQIQALNELDMPTRLSGQDLPREVTEGVGEGDVIDTRPRGTMGEGGLTQGIGELPKINDTSQADRNKMRENPNLEQIWGKYAYDPAARKKAYLDNLKKIYRKAMLLDAIAALTGGESRSKQYLQMATGRLNEIDKFDEEERISNIWREVFTNDEGKFDMPSSKSEAGRRAAQLGASPKLLRIYLVQYQKRRRGINTLRLIPMIRLSGRLRGSILIRVKNGLEELRQLRRRLRTNLHTTSKTSDTGKHLKRLIQNWLTLLVGRLVQYQETRQSHHLSGPASSLKTYQPEG